MKGPLAKRYPELKGCLFIVTYGRSGSTVLQSILQSIPGAHISGENFNALWGLQQAVTSVRRSKRAWGKKPRAANHPWYMADHLDPNSFADKAMTLFVEEVLNPPADVRWLGFKEIRYPVTGDRLEPLLDFMRNRFPRAHLVFNSRNPEDVARSKWWRNKPAEDVIAMVHEMDARFAAYTAKHPGQCFHLQHEDTISDGTGLRAVFAALDEPFDPEMAKQILSRPLKH